MSQKDKASSTSFFPWKEVLTFLGIVLAAYIGYLGIRYQTEFPVQATQTAEAKQTEYAISSTMTGLANPASPASNDMPIPMYTATQTPTKTPIPTATEKSISIAGDWKGTTTGTNNGQPISERATTVSIPPNCQSGKECGFFSTEGACTYQMTLIAVQNNVFEFESISVSGADFCYSGDVSKDKVKITLVSNSEIFFHYETQPSVVIREGTLTR